MASSLLFQPAPGAVGSPVADVDGCGGLPLVELAAELGQRLAIEDGVGVLKLPTGEVVDEVLEELLGEGAVEGHRARHPARSMGLESRARLVLVTGLFLEEE